MKTFGCLILLGALLPAVSLGQTAQATLTGHVLDASGTAVPSIEVEATDFKKFTRSGLALGVNQVMNVD